jgi:hypothetical protein
MFRKPSQTCWPGACNTTILHGFGGKYGSYDPNKVEDYVSWLNALCGSRYYVASVCYGQAKAVKALKIAGFKCSTWNRLGWSGRKARIFWKPSGIKGGGIDDPIYADGGKKTKNGSRNKYYEY